MGQLSQNLNGQESAVFSKWISGPVTRRVFFIFLVSLGGVRLSPLGTSATLGLLYQPRIIEDDYGAVGGMRIGRGNQSTRRKPDPVPLCSPQIPQDLTWDRIRAAAVGSQRLTARVMARPRVSVHHRLTACKEQKLSYLPTRFLWFGLRKVCNVYCA
jgi:hypothetical protein